MTAQAAMRHSKIDLTMNVYTDTRLMDVAGALDALPMLPLTGPAKECGRMTGTDARAVAPTVAPTRCNGGQIGSNAVNLHKVLEAMSERAALAVTSSPVKAKDSLTSAVNESDRVGATGLEPVTPSVPSCFSGFHQRPPPSAIACGVAVFAFLITSVSADFPPCAATWLQLGYSDLGSQTTLFCGLVQSQVTDAGK